MNKRNNEGIGSNYGIATVASCSFRHQNMRREGEFAGDHFMEGNDS